METFKKQLNDIKTHNKHVLKFYESQYDNLYKEYCKKLSKEMSKQSKKKQVENIEKKKLFWFINITTKRIVDEWKIVETPYIPIIKEEFIEILNDMVKNSDLIDVYYCNYYDTPRFSAKLHISSFVNKQNFKYINSENKLEEIINAMHICDEITIDSQFLSYLKTLDNLIAEPIIKKD